MIGVGLWLSAALVAGLAGLPARMQPPLPQLLVAALALLSIAAGLLHPCLRAWVFAVDERVLIALHLSRFVGIAFLVLHARGELPWAFAVPGGIGDIVVACCALLLIAAIPVNSPRGRSAHLLWNLLGLADILFVVATAARIGMTEPASMAALYRLPLCLLPTWLVPLIIATHVLLLVRMTRTRA